MEQRKVGEKSDSLQDLTNEIINGSLDMPKLLDNEVEIARNILSSLKGMKTARAINTLQVCLKTIPYISSI